MSQNNPINQHTVPQTYLRSFLNKENKLCLFNLKTRKIKRRNTKWFTVKKDFYTVIDKKGNKNYFIEHFFNKEIENFFGITIKKIKNKQSLNITDKVTLAKFIVVQYMRTPKYRKSKQRNMTNGINEVIKLIENANPNDKDNVLGNLQKEKQAIEKKEFTLRLLLENLYEFTTILLSQNWSLLEAPDGVSFITSDNPVTLINYHSKTNIFSGTGLLNSDKIIPLTPKFCLFIDDNIVGLLNETVFTKKIDENHVMNINNITAINSHCFWVSNNEESLNQTYQTLLNNK